MEYVYLYIYIIPNQKMSPSMSFWSECVWSRSWRGCTPIIKNTATPCNYPLRWNRALVAFHLTSLQPPFDPGTESKVGPCRVIHLIWAYMDFSQNVGGWPLNHPFIDGFSTINHKPSILGVPHLQARSVWARTWGGPPPQHLRWASKTRQRFPSNPSN